MATPEAASTDRRPWMVALSAAFVLAIALAAFFVGRATDDDEASTATTTTSTPATATSPTTPTTSRPTTTSTSGAGTTTTQPPVIDTSTAVWPVAGSGTTYDDPVEAARGFAVDLLGFRDPVLGAFQAGDSRSGEVELRPVANGPVTTVFVRQLSGSDDWWVLGAATANIQVTAPEALQVITSPVALAGTSTAFEAQVTVLLYEDGTDEPIGTGYVMGGSMGDVAPFTGSLDFRTPSAEHGALVLLTQSMQDGSTWEASVLRVGLG